MQIQSLLLALALGLVPATKGSSDDGHMLARSAASAHKDTVTLAERHLPGRSGVYDKKKRQSGFNPESYVNNAMGGSDTGMTSSSLNGDSTGTGSDIDNGAGRNSGTGNTGSGNTGYGDTGAGDVGTGHTGGGQTGTGNSDNGSGVPANKAAPVRQVSDLTTPATDVTSSQGSVPASSNTGGGSTEGGNTGGGSLGGGSTRGGNTGGGSTEGGSTGGGGNCNSNPSPNGCANEDGASTGDPGWTCSSGSSPSASNNRRDLSSLRFHPRQNIPSYVQTLNTWRCKFCLPPLTYSSALEASAQRQSQDAAAQGSMVETPATGEGTVMAEGGGPSFETAVLFWICEVHTTNIDSCTCANAYEHFTWTERGHYDFLVGKEAGQFGSVGCVYNEAMGGLWTCSLGMN